MKEKLIKEYFNSRRLIEKALKINHLDDKGSRKELEERLQSLTYDQLMTTLDKMS